MRRLKVLSDWDSTNPVGAASNHALRGEAQRLKFPRIGQAGSPGTLYVLDEPTTGLHMHEVGMLVQVLHRLGITAPLLCSSNTIWMSWPPRTTY